MAGMSRACGVGGRGVIRHRAPALSRRVIVDRHRHLRYRLRWCSWRVVEFKAVAEYLREAALDENESKAAIEGHFETSHDDRRRRLAVPLSPQVAQEHQYQAPNGNCVEVRLDPAGVAVRDSKDSDGPQLTLQSRDWQLFLDAVKSSRL
jgi:uncharacterized protein DUF397